MDDLQDKLLGTYLGRCTNLTAEPPITAEIVLVLKRFQDKEVIGDLTVHGHLHGGSEFSGVLSGERLTFVTRTSNKKSSITWSGIFSKEGILGEYVVVHESFLRVLLLGTRTERGVWQCVKRDTL
jgi:hypothetical protein